MLEWVLGIDKKAIYWMFGTIILYLILLLTGKYNAIQANYSGFKKLISILFVFILGIISFYFISSKNQVVVYEVDNINELNYTELLETIKKEFNPDDGNIYQMDCCTEISIKYVDQYKNDSTILSINHIMFIKNHKIYTIHILNHKNTIIIKESKESIFGINKIKTNIEIDDMMNAMDKLNIDHIKVNLDLDYEDFAFLQYKDWESLNSSSVQSDTRINRFIINKNNEITPITDLEWITPNDYIVFTVSKFERTSEYEIHEINITHQLSEMIYYYIEK